MTEQDKEKDVKNMVEVCPITGIKKEKKVANYKEEDTLWEQKQIPPFSKYAAEAYPDVCIGDCENCKNWKKLTEKEFFFKENNTAMNKFKYKIKEIAGSFFIGIIIGTIPTLMFFKSLVFVPMMGLSFVLIREVIDFHTFRFEDYLEEKWEEQETKKEKAYLEENGMLDANGKTIESVQEK